MPTCRWLRPSSAAVSAATVSSADLPDRRSASPSGPYRGFAYACVATAPTSGSAHGTTEPTARNFDCVATPHCRASRSQAAIEYVATTGSAIGQLHQVEVEELAPVGRAEGGSDLGPRERRLHLLGAARADDHRAPPLVRLAQGLHVGHV